MKLKNNRRHKRRRKHSIEFLPNRLRRQKSVRSFQRPKIRKLSKTVASLLRTTTVIVVTEVIRVTLVIVQMMTMAIRRKRMEEVRGVPAPMEDPVQRTKVGCTQLKRQPSELRLCSRLSHKFC